MISSHEELTKSVIGAAIEVHRVLGSGLAEVHYKRALSIELRLRGISHELEALVELHYKGFSLGEGKIDILVEDTLIVELKTVEALHDAHTKQVVAYLKARDAPAGLLLHFSHSTLREGIRRVVN